MAQANFTAVSNALQVDADIYNQPISEAIAAIDSVHGDGALPIIPVKRALMTNKHGLYVLQQPDQAAAILISYFTDHAEFTTVHEVGHFLDFHAFGTGTQSASRSGDILRGWCAAVKSSQAVQHLGHLWQSSASMTTVRQPDGFVVEYPISQRYVKYLLTPEELWARGYSQFIAVKSGNPALLHQLNRLRVRSADAYYYADQWDDADFVPIMAEIQAVFQQKEWMT